MRITSIFAAILAIAMVLAACGEPNEPTAQETGTLNLFVDGLPEGESGWIVVWDADDDWVIHQPPTGTTLPVIVPVGEYTVTAGVRTVDGTQYVGADGGAYTVLADEVHTVATTYHMASQLRVDVAGIPGGGFMEHVEAHVEVTGPHGFHETITRSQWLTELLPGQYTITPHPAHTSLGTFRPGEPVTVNIVPGDSIDEVAEYSRVRTLVYTAQSIQPPMVAALALEGLDIDLYSLTEDDAAAASAALAGLNYDLAIWLMNRSGAGGPWRPDEADVEAFLASGGRMIYQSTQGIGFIGSADEAAIAAHFGADRAETMNEGEFELHPELATDMTNPLVISINDPESTIAYAMRLEPLGAAAESVCTFAGTTDDSCAILSNDGRSLYMGIPVVPGGGYTMDTDDSLQLLRNAINLLLD